MMLHFRTELCWLHVSTFFLSSLIAKHHHLIQIISLKHHIRFSDRRSTPTTVRLLAALLAFRHFLVASSSHFLDDLSPSVFRYYCIALLKSTSSEATSCSVMYYYCTVLRREKTTAFGETPHGEETPAVPIGSNTHFGHWIQQYICIGSNTLLDPTTIGSNMFVHTILILSKFTISFFNSRARGLFSSNSRCSRSLSHYCWIQCLLDPTCIGSNIHWIQCPLVPMLKQLNEHHVGSNGAMRIMLDPMVRLAFPLHVGFLQMLSFFHQWYYITVQWLRTTETGSDLLEQSPSVFSV